MVSSHYEPLLLSQKPFDWFYKSICTKIWHLSTSIFPTPTLSYSIFKTPMLHTEKHHPGTSLSSPLISQIQPMKHWEICVNMHCEEPAHSYGCYLDKSETHTSGCQERPAKTLRKDMLHRQNFSLFREASALLIGLSTD